MFLVRVFLASHENARDRQVDSLQQPGHVNQQHHGAVLSATRCRHTAQPSELLFHSRLGAQLNELFALGLGRLAGDEQVAEELKLGGSYPLLRVRAGEEAGDGAQQGLEAAPVVGGDGVQRDELGEDDARELLGGQNGCLLQQLRQRAADLVLVDVLHAAPGE